MNERRGPLIGGIILISLGVLFLLAQFMPDLFGDWFTWPLIIIGIGVAFLIGALVSREGGLAVPGVIVGGIGLILYYQNATGDWTSWAYVWTLIPGFVGIGILLAGLIDGNLRKDLSGGLFLVGISAVGFLIFGGAINLGWDIWRYWPVILIVAGLIAIAQVLLRSSKE